MENDQAKNMNQLRFVRRMTKVFKPVKKKRFEQIPREISATIADPKSPTPVINFDHSVEQDFNESVLSETCDYT